MGMIDEDVEIKRFENFDGEYDNPDMEDCLEY